MKTVTFPALPSTNTYVSQHLADLSLPCVVRAVAQTAGRGQRGNGWEAEPGRNLTVSFYFKPFGVLPREQFAVSEAVALGVADTLRAYGVEACVKWPNDIYVGDRKICGILIEHSLFGSEIRHSIAGVGLNVNQTRFLSDAPNPVSMTMLTGEEYDLDDVLRALASSIERRLAGIGEAEERGRLHTEFMRRLWRGEPGPWPFREAASGETIAADIEDVSPEGYLTLRPADGSPARRYAFKEVVFLLTDSEENI